MKFNEFVTSGKPNEADNYLGLLMASASYFHSAHFETKSYSRHKAYDNFFSNIPALTDSFGETWLGFSGKKYSPAIPTQKDLPLDTIKMLDHIISESERIYETMPGAIKNIIDEINALCYQTKYLLSLD